MVKMSRFILKVFLVMSFHVINQVKFFLHKVESPTSLMRRLNNKIIVGLGVYEVLCTLFDVFFDRFGIECLGR